MAASVRTCRAGSERIGKSERPDGGDGAGLTPPAATGSDADQIIDEARRRTVSRRELSGSPMFDDISPDARSLIGWDDSVSRVGQPDRSATHNFAVGHDPDDVLAGLDLGQCAGDHDAGVIIAR